MASTGYDSEDRLLDYAAAVIALVDGLPANRSVNHVAGQLLRSGTSPLPNHGEAQAAESRADFLHKMRICLKELRESRRWLRLICRSPALRPAGVAEAERLVTETEELIRIFFTSVRTAGANGKARGTPTKAADAAFGRHALPRPSGPPLNVGR